MSYNPERDVVGAILGKALHCKIHLSVTRDSIACKRNFWLSATPLVALVTCRSCVKAWTRAEATSPGKPEDSP